jgi:uncharacterized protein (TIGR03790 family)
MAMMHRALSLLRSTGLGLMLAWLLPSLAQAGGEEVIVIYNSRVPESKAVAEYYAKARQVPRKQIFGFGLTTNEIMTRADFTDILQKPLAARLEDAGLWRFSEQAIRGNNGRVERTEFRVTQSKIRYAVLCWGMPLKIAETSPLEEIAAKLMNEPLRRNEAAVDSELAWLPLIKQSVPLTGPLQSPLYGCTNRSLLDCSNGLLMVTRLDGPTPEIAKGIVDKSIAAETTGLWGRAYLDARGLGTNDNYYLGDEWMLASAALCRIFGFETELDTKPETLPAGFPMSHIAIYAGWYAGDVCGPFLAPKMEFMPGAFAYHLHSFSAATLRSAEKNWCGPLLARGATCTMGCVNEPYLQFTPNIAQFLLALGNGFTFGEAAWAAQNSLSWQTTVIGDPLYQPFKQSPTEMHAALARTKNPLLEWSFDRLVCLDLARSIRAPQLIQFLQNIPTTETSAVLTEKLAALYDEAGKPSSALAAWQTALTLNPSPQQRLRLRLILGKKLAEQNDFTEAIKNYKALLTEQPGYPDKAVIEEKIQYLEQKLNAPAKP